MFERRCLELSPHIVGTGPLRIGGRDGNYFSGSSKKPVDVTDLDGVPNYDVGKALRDLKVNPSAGYQAGESREHLAKAHQVASTLRVDTHGAGKGCAHGHAAQSRLDYRYLCAQRQLTGLQDVQLVLRYQ